MSCCTVTDEPGDEPPPRQPRRRSESFAAAALTTQLQKTLIELSKSVSAQLPATQLLVHGPYSKWVLFALIDPFAYGSLAAGPLWSEA